jgi:hypothetical protein
MKPLNATETEALMQAYRKRMTGQSRAALWEALFWLGCVALPAALALAWSIAR